MSNTAPWHEPGWFTVAIGHSSADPPLTGRFRITGSTRATGGERVMTTPARLD
ncbi:hypothetical protein [Glycomyces sp. NRRL B-16210]|uniref:hypothetical protein n=1 Tax=Glycomyces sp. NRRL B-16210 TaxID=1463821 RepID=UPI000A5BC5FA|nr:hypothetical protein [Glycomyces sp. NRRL B-16210]